MKICGLIAEFDPFHNGHRYIVSKAKELSGCDVLFVVMSGNVIQRGKLATLPKQARAREAIKHGADAVIELPAAFSLSASTDFCGYGIKMLVNAGIDSLICGVEKLNGEQIKKMADIKEDSQKLRALLDKGIGFPKAIREANKVDCEYKPNDLLGIEYARAIERENSSVNIVTVKRKDKGYDSDILISDTPFASASAIRKAIENKDIESIRPYVPKAIFDDIANAHMLNYDTLNSIIKWTFSSHESEYFSRINGFTEGIENRFIKYALSNTEDIVKSVATKRYANSKLARLVLCGILNIDKCAVEQAKNNCCYFKILSIKNSTKSQVLKTLDKKRTIIKYSDILNICDSGTRELYIQSERADRLFNLCYGYENKPYVMEIIDN